MKALVEEEGSEKYPLDISQLLSLENIHCHSASYADETQFLATRTTMTYHSPRALNQGLRDGFGDDFERASEEATQIFNSPSSMGLRMYLEFLENLQSYWLPDRQYFHRGDKRTNIVATKLLSTSFKRTTGIEESEQDLLDALGAYGTLAIQILYMARPQGLCVEMKSVAWKRSDKATARSRPSRVIKDDAYRVDPPSPVASDYEDERKISDNDCDEYDEGGWNVKSEQMINRYFVSLTDEIVRCIPGPAMEAHMQKFDLKVGCGKGKTHTAWSDGWVSSVSPRGKFGYLALIETKTSCAINDTRQTYQRATEMAGMAANDMLSVVGVVDCEERPCKL